jgi:hypothetical protein
MVKVILVLFILVLTSCKKDPQPNYLFILIENLNSKTIYCDAEESQKTRSGLQIICDEFNKFTHVYTTSVQTLPALSSLLTGLYPYSHNVRSNTDNFLSPEFKTFIESAKESENYKTHFISGGQPFFRKGGIHQGFDIFDDHIISEKDMRPLKESLSIYFDILKEEKFENHISMIHVSDLKYPFKETQNDLGETRNLTFDSQLEEIDEKLFHLFSKLKSEKTWENTKVFIIGLNGLPNPDFNLEYQPLSLKSDNTQVGFYFKDIKKNSINSKPQTINTALSLKDIGQMLNNSFNKDNKQSANFQKFDVEKIEAYKKETSDYIVIESAWAKSNQLAEIRSAIVDENHLFIFDRKTQIFNKLSDSNEQYPQPINASLKEKVTAYEKYLTEKNFQPFSKTKELENAINEIELLSKGDYNQQDHSEFYSYFSLLSFIEKKDISRVEALLKKYPHLKSDPCLNNYPKIFAVPNLKKNCQNPVSSLFIDFANPAKSGNKDLKNLVLNEIINFNILKNLYRRNLKLNLDYYPINTFKLDLLKPYIILTLTTN